MLHVGHRDVSISRLLKLIAGIVLLLAGGYGTFVVAPSIAVYFLLRHGSPGAGGPIGEAGSDISGAVASLALLAVGFLLIRGNSRRIE